jgi:predicted neutral ceramidase superfamily lipid hydrolase
VVVGLALAGAYHLSAARSHQWLSLRNGKAAPLLAVGSMFLRLTLVTALFLALALWTSLRVLPMALAFVGLFTALLVLELVRFGSGKGHLHPTTHAD